MKRESQKNDGEEDGEGSYCPSRPRVNAAAFILSLLAAPVHTQRSVLVQAPRLAWRGTPSPRAASETKGAECGNLGFLATVQSLEEERRKAHWP